MKASFNENRRGLAKVGVVTLNFSRAHSKEPPFLNSWIPPLESSAATKRSVFSATLSNAFLALDPRLLLLRSVVIFLKSNPSVGKS